MLGLTPNSHHTITITSFSLCMLCSVGRNWKIQPAQSCHVSDCTQNMLNYSIQVRKSCSTQHVLHGAYNSSLSAICLGFKIFEIKLAIQLWRLVYSWMFTVVCQRIETQQCRLFCFLVGVSNIKYLKKTVGVLPRIDGCRGVLNSIYTHFFHRSIFLILIWYNVHVFKINFP